MSEPEEERGPPSRPRPDLTPFNEAFWTGGKDGGLRIQRCRECDRWYHPPGARCPRCLSGDLHYDAVSGRGEVFSFAVLHHAYRPGLVTPYVVALVELTDQPGLRVTSNIVGCPASDVAIGMPVAVQFEAMGEGLYAPVFAPALR